MNKKGVVHAYELVDVIILILLVLVGFFALNITSDQNTRNAEEKAATERDVYLAKEMLYILTTKTVETSKEEITYSQVLDKYYALRVNNDKTDEEDDYEDELRALLKAEADVIFGTSRPYITVDLYKDGLPVDDQLELYEDKYAAISYLPMDMIPLAFIATVFDNSDYITSVIVPSSINRGQNYYINISMSFYS